MKCKQIRERAEALGLDSAHLNKKEIIHAIQIAEGNFPCFLTAQDFCDQANCCWRADCLAPHWCNNGRLTEITTELESLLAIMTTENNKKRLINKQITREQTDRYHLESPWENIRKVLQKISTRF
jgi:hypothetical protein